MKKQLRLSLKMETIRELQVSRLTEAIGGVIDTWTNPEPPPPTNTCNQHCYTARVGDTHCL